MDIAAILKELNDQREAVEQAIASVERLAGGQGKRRGRPPAWMKRIEQAPMSAAASKRNIGRAPKSKEAQKASSSKD